MEGIRRRALSLQGRRRGPGAAAHVRAVVEGLTFSGVATWVAGEGAPQFTDGASVKTAWTGRCDGCTPMNPTRMVGEVGTASMSILTQGTGFSTTRRVLRHVAR
ncbi:hypothetical protein BHE74_00045822 [Ensete ventricosum]|uniref:Uncharacterized protein n=1 Tax=Ensete ventricosum TaxID=4639 RepID=A0A445MEV1_ENSVE|nr:hypothetical protein BHE74_00045822 [Ensete ventricosum]RZR72739.1 hypothetical protein BHM03_00016214 [Ensete ventricosum]